MSLKGFARHHVRPTQIIKGFWSLLVHPGGARCRDSVPEDMKLLRGTNLVSWQQSPLSFLALTFDDCHVLFPAGALPRFKFSAVLDLNCAKIAWYPAHPSTGKPKTLLGKKQSDLGHSGISWPLYVFTDVIE